MTIHAKVSQTTKHIGNMSAKNMSDYDQYGNPEKEPNWPFMMRLLPNDPCKVPDAYNQRTPYWEQMTNGCLKKGYSLFDVMALDQPEELGGVEKQIGEIILTSDPVTSTWADTRLFFRHQRFDEDLSERPQWKVGIEEFEHPTFFENLPLPNEAPNNCPFAFLFGLL